MNTFEPLIAGMIVFGIILLSGALLLCYIFITMRYSKRNQQLLMRELDRRYVAVEKIVEEVFTSMSSETIQKIRETPSWQEREILLVEPVQTHLADISKKINVSAVRSLLLFNYFGGHKDYS